MLKKLIKYEILADWKKYGIVSAALFLISIMLFGFLKMPAFADGFIINIYISTIISVIWFTLAAVALAMLFVFATIKFYKSFIRDEGYLMHTLPVPTWQLIASNLIAVYIWFIFLAVILIICGGIAMGAPLWLFSIIKNRSELMEFIANGVDAEAVPELIRMIIITAIMAILAPAMYMTQIYLSFALGNLFSRNKLAMSVLMYFAVSFAEQILLSIALLPFALKIAALGDDISDQQTFRLSGDISLLSGVVSIFAAIGFFIAAERIFAKKLNLE